MMMQTCYKKVMSEYFTIFSFSPVKKGAIGISTEKRILAFMHLMAFIMHI